MRKVLFIGAKPDLVKNHPGGQSTAAYGLLHYCYDNDIRLDIIDSAQESFPIPSIGKRVFRAFKRLILLVSRLSLNRYDGAIIFSGAGFSFIEKILLAAVCRVFFTKTIFFVRSGFFMSDCEVSWKRTMFAILLKIPKFLGSQGISWNQLYESLGVPESKIKLIPNWLSPLKQPCTSPKVYVDQLEVKLTFLFVGWMVKAKGVCDIFDSIETSEVLKRHRFVFAGDGEKKKELEERSKHNQFQNVDFLGWQSSDEIERLMKTSDVFVFPIHFEGFPNVIVEALAAALPIVTTGVGGIKDSAIDGYNAFIVGVADTDALRDALEVLVADIDLRNQFSKNSLAVFNQRHDLYANCTKMMDVLT